MIAVLVSTPFVVRLLGPVAYGAWAVVQMIFRYLRLGDLGMAATSTRFATAAYANGDADGEAAATWTAVLITSVLQVTIAGVVALEATRVAELFQLPRSLLGPGTLAIRFTCVAVVLRAASETLDTPIAVRLRWRAYTLLTVGPATAGLLLAPLALYAVRSLATPALVVACAAGLAVIDNLVAGRRVQPAMRRPRLNRALVRPMLAQGLSSGGADILWLVLNTCERLFVVWFVGLVAVGQYAVGASLAAIVLLVPAATDQLLLPAFVRLGTHATSRALELTYKTVFSWVAVLMTPFVLSLGFLAEPFLRLWVGESYAVAASLPCIIMLGGAWFEAISHVPRAYLLASGRAQLLARVRGAELVPYIALAAGLTWWLHLPGAALAWSLQSCLEAIILVVMARRAHRGDLSVTPDRPLLILLSGCGSAAALGFLGHLLPSLIERVPVTVLLVCAWATGAWIFYLDLQARSSIKAGLAAQRQKWHRVGQLPPPAA